MDVYQRAWASLLKRIEAKTSWGRNELKEAMLEALVEAHPTAQEMSAEWSGEGRYTPQGHGVGSG